MVQERVVVLHGNRIDKILRYEEDFCNQNMCGWWYPGCEMNRAPKADWSEGFESMTSRLAPIFCCFNEREESFLMIACSEVREKVQIRCGIIEETGAIHVEIQIPLDFLENTKEYEARFLISERKERYETALERAVQWWENNGIAVPMQVPMTARLPMYSTWYSFHQQMSADALNHECELAKTFGMDTVIVDDGWQTDDISRGYAYCGDWKICENKFPDFREHVAHIHKLGMKYMLWLSVPFVGKNSEQWDIYKECLLRYDDSAKVGVLDPRYPKVRTYIQGTCRRLVEKYDLDGLKLDFIDQFYQNVGDDSELKNEMDYYSVQDAVDRLMREISEDLLRIKPEIMIEFRQKYIGPSMRGYGNIFRVVDCPGAWLYNRVGIVDLRLLGGNSAIHSDMIMWHPQATPQEIAVHLINSIWGTLQISVKLENLSSDEKAVLSFWLNFARKHVELLQKGKLTAHNPLQLYPVVETRKGGLWAAALYENQQVISVPDDIVEGWIMYAGPSGKLYVETESEFHIEIFDCMGQKVKQMTIIQGLHMVSMDMGMMMYLKTERRVNKKI